MKTTDVILTPGQITNSTDEIVLAVEVRDGYDYVDGKKAEIPTFKRVTLVIPKRKYEQVVVKVYDMNIPLTEEMIEQKGGSVKVKLKNLSGRFYLDRESHEYRLSCKADGLLEVIS